MSDRPILFSAPMVRAILADRKTQTRRALNPQPVKSFNAIFCRDGKWSSGDALTGDEIEPLRVPYRIGDRLWVREPYYQYGHWEKYGLTRTGREKWFFVADMETILFDKPTSAVFNNHFRPYGGSEPSTPAWHKRLGRFMCRKYSRLTLTLTDDRVQLLQEISEEDAIAEGLERDEFGFKSYSLGHAYHLDARGSFASLWLSINGVGSWDSNPWVAAYSFSVEQRNIDS